MMRRHKRLHSQSTDTTESPKRPKRSVRSTEKKTLVERINALTIPQFSAQFFPQERAESIRSSTGLHLSLSTWTEMLPSLREACINLLEMTSASHYCASEKGWSRPKKLKEMRHPAMKYLLLLAQEGDNVDDIQAFLSFMITEEDGCEVIYCYELHLQPPLQGKGVGRRLMELMEMIGFRVGVEKVMLTVFRPNERAVKAYGSWGYSVDEFSPEPRKLRDGTIKEATYVILSKERGGFAQGLWGHGQTTACEISEAAKQNEIRKEE